MARSRRLPAAFFDRDAQLVAPNLLGKLIVRSTPEGRVTARLVEVEAYRGGDDPGSHAYRGRTPRNAAMFGPPATLYVYFIYGMHWCVNVVCGPSDTPHAVLLRAAEPVSGLELMRARRAKPHDRRHRPDRELLRGPGNLAAALGIDRSLDGRSLGAQCVIVDDGLEVGAITTTSRVGLGPGRGEELLLRYCITDNPHTSGVIRR